MGIHLYTDAASRAVLLGERQKLMLIGGDFGYGNFGDLLQHVNAARIAGESGRFATVSVLAANAIASPDFPARAGQAYGSDAVVYVAEHPLIFDGDLPPLELVAEIRNLAAVWLYGGGFLNDMWGEFVLGVCEHFLRLAPEATYLASGQQVTSPFESRVVSHVKAFRPRIFGVRDELSVQSLSGAGFNPDFSFDDATEALIGLSAAMPLRPGPGLLVHLNSSGYTANATMQRGLGDELARLGREAAARECVTLLQAYRDPRHEVQDSRETIKKLDARFPFHDYRGVELASLAYADAEPRLAGALSGRVGYSCSYHVALWLQLAGIPCWLRSSNPFYSQKSRALQVAQDLESFLAEPGLADHSVNLERRALWRERFARELEGVPEARGLCRIEANVDGPGPRSFFFKGEPAIEERLAQAVRDADSARVELAGARQEVDSLRGRLDALGAQLTEVGHEAHMQRERGEVAEAQRARAAEDSRDRDARLAGVIHEAYLQRDRAVGAETEARLRADAAQAQLQLMLSSRSWRLTRPLRALARRIRRDRGA